MEIENSSILLLLRPLIFWCRIMKSFLDSLGIKLFLTGSWFLLTFKSL
jgi:hypothetical protein